MDNFQIETAQNISIQQNVAGIGERILAFLIDLAVIVFYLVLAGMAMAGLGSDSGSELMYYLVLGLPPFLYFLLWESFWNGQTPGKALLQIRVVRKDGSRPSFSNFLIRWLLRFVDISLSAGGIAVVSILLNGKGQRLGDIAAGTTVITEKKFTGIEKSLAVDLPDNYRPSYPQVTVLSDQDIQEVKNLFELSRRKEQHHIIIALSEKLSSLMDVKPEEKPVDFVKKVISDYNYFTRL